MTINASLSPQSRNDSTNITTPSGILCNVKSIGRNVISSILLLTLSMTPGTTTSFVITGQHYRRLNRQSRLQSPQNNKKTIIRLNVQSSPIKDNGSGSSNITPPKRPPTIHTPSSSVSTTTTAKDEQNAELWLDLRGTAITPRAALDYLLEELSQDDSGGNDEDTSGETLPLMVNRVLVSETADTKLKENTLQRHVVTGEVKTDVLTVTSDNLITFPRDKGNDAVTIGEITGLQNHDPVRILTCVEEGDWIVIDTQDVKEQKDRCGAVTTLIDFLGTVLSSTSGAGMLMLGEGDWAVDERKERGGVAITCTTSTDVFQSGTCLRTLMMACGDDGMSMASSKDGIIFRVASEIVGEKMCRGVKSAIVLPFDVALWKRVAVFFREVSFEEEGEETC